MIVWLVRAAVAEPAIAAELLRLATSAVAEVTGLGGGDVSVGAEADFVVLESNRRRQSVTTEAAYEPLALSSINFGSDGDGKRTRCWCNGFWCPILVQWVEVLVQRHRGRKRI